MDSCVFAQDVITIECYRPTASCRFHYLWERNGNMFPILLMTTVLVFRSSATHHYSPANGVSTQMKCFRLLSSLLFVDTACDGVKAEAVE